MDPVSMLSIAAVVALSVRALREGQTHDNKDQGHESQSSPECLNFRVDRQAVDRLRDPTLPLFGKRFSDSAERETWLRYIAESKAYVLRSEPWDQIAPQQGRLYEHHALRQGSLHEDQNLREFARLGYEVQALSSVNLPRFYGLRVNEYLDRIERVWEEFPPCELAASRMQASPAQIKRFLKTLLELHRIGLKVETISIWHLVQKENGEFFIPHIPQARDLSFPCNLQFKIYLAKPKEEARRVSSAHLFSPSDKFGDHRSFQFQLGSFVWRLLAEAWPYDKEPLLGARGESPSRVLYDFGESLTPVLLRLTSLEPQDRYQNLCSALEELAEA